MTVSEKLRLVQGLHSHAEMFGFKWDDDSDWTWHDVACKIADEVDAENAKLRELVHILAYCMSEDCDCDRCVLNEADMPTPRISACYSLPDRIRELGVEVETE